MKVVIAFVLKMSLKIGLLTIPCMKFTIALLLSSVSIFSSSENTLFIWPNVAPGENPSEIKNETRIEPKNKSDVLRITNVSKPTLEFFVPSGNANGTAVIVCPGGGYNILAYQHEGIDVCKWLNSIGVTVFYLNIEFQEGKKRKHEAPLQDAQRSIGLVRQQAKKWNIDPDKIGILGFSAGGNLAVMASTSYQKRLYDKVDSADMISCRPDFAILIYPAYLVDRVKRDRLFPEVKVSSSSPPCFFAHTGDDHVPAEGSALLYLALEKAGVVGNELHLYPFGGHGYGMKPSVNFVSSWPKRAENWMSSMGWLYR